MSFLTGFMRGFLKGRWNGLKNKRIEGRFSSRWFFSTGFCWYDLIDFDTCGSISHIFTNFKSVKHFCSAVHISISFRLGNRLFSWGVVPFGFLKQTCVLSVCSQPDIHWQRLLLALQQFVPSSDLTETSAAKPLLLQTTWVKGSRVKRVNNYRSGVAACVVTRWCLSG